VDGKVSLLDRRRKIRAASASRKVSDQSSGRDGELTFQTNAGDGLCAPKSLLGDDQIAGKAAKNRSCGLKSVMPVHTCLLGGDRLEFTVQMLTSRDIAGRPGESSIDFQVGRTASHAGIRWLNRSSLPLSIPQQAQNSSAVNTGQKSRPHPIARFALSKWQTGRCS
jgi:hypothetical protein